MHRYCKAYPLEQFRRYHEWTEQQEANEPALTDDSIGYLWDDFTAVRSPVQKKGIIFDDVTPRWRAFCENTLQFAFLKTCATLMRKRKHPPEYLFTDYPIQMDHLLEERFFHREVDAFPVNVVTR